VKVFGCGQEPGKSISDLLTKAQQTIERARSIQARTDPSLGTRTDRAVFTFLITDLRVGMTFTQIASDALEGSEKRTRNQANARRAYDSVSGISHRASLSDEERDDVDGKLTRLRLTLVALGEVFR
jgi:hypothetical protein